MREHTLTPRFSKVSWQEQRTRGDNQTDGLKPLYANDCVIDKPLSSIFIAMIKMTGASDESIR